MPTTTVANSELTVQETGRAMPPSGHRKLILIVGVVLILSVSVGVLLCIRYWPFSEKSVVKNLVEISDSDVSVQSYRPTYFPHPGCILEGVEFRHGLDHFKLITIQKLEIQGSYAGLLARHIPRMVADGSHVFIPPFGSKMTFNTIHSGLHVGEIVANGSTVEFLSNNPQGHALRFDVHEGLLSDLRWGSPFSYRLKFHNPSPPGEIAVSGKFGPWAEGHSQDTPMSGTYTLDHADLGVYGGIDGTLSSQGKFGGPFRHVDVNGVIDTPNFHVESSSHRFKLQTQFDAFVNAMNGDVFLNRVDAHFGRTSVVAEGSIAGTPGEKGKTAKLHFASRSARIEDVLGLFVSAPRAPMSGPMSLSARAELPPGNQPFLEKVKLRGSFGIDDGTFTKADTQRNVDQLSAGARGEKGEKKEDPETVLTDLKGAVDLSGGIAHFLDLNFGVPGATSKMQGTYNIINHRIDLHGRMHVDTKISNTSSGAKALLLKVMDPFFKKRKKGEIVPVYVGGTYEKPQFGLDLASKKEGKK